MRETKTNLPVLVDFQIFLLSSKSLEENFGAKMILSGLLSGLEVPVID